MFDFPIDMFEVVSRFILNSYQVFSKVVYIILKEWGSCPRQEPRQSCRLCLHAFLLSIDSLADHRLLRAWCRLSCSCQGARQSHCRRRRHLLVPFSLQLPGRSVHPSLLPILCRRRSLQSHLFLCGNVFSPHLFLPHHHRHLPVRQLL